MGRDPAREEAGQHAVRGRGLYLRHEKALDISICNLYKLSTGGGREAIESHNQSYIHFLPDGH